MIAITGATGQLGRLVVEQLLAVTPASEIVAAVRSPEKASELSRKGVQVRQADFDQPATLASALQGVDKLLLVSSNAMGKREAQHEAVIAAAKKAGVKLIAYTSILHADTTSIGLAGEHLATEKALRASGIPFVLLRNGWYLENYTAQLGPVLEHGALTGASRDGRIAAAARADYAAAAVKVLTTPGHENKVYELAGDESFSKADLAAEVARAAGKPVVYNDVPASAYVESLEGHGLPAAVAMMLANADEGIARGDLDDKSGDLHRLLGRATTPLATAVAAGVKAR